MKSTSVVLAALALAFLLGGAAEMTLGPTKYATVVLLTHTVVCAFLIFLWYRLDSDERGFRRRPVLSAGVVALSFIAVPTYLFLSRGAKRGFASLGWLLLYALVCLALAATGGMIGVTFAAS